MLIYKSSKEPYDEKIVKKQNVSQIFTWDIIQFNIYKILRVHINLWEKYLDYKR